MHACVRMIVCPPYVCQYHLCAYTLTFVRIQVNTSSLGMAWVCYLAAVGCSCFVFPGGSRGWGVARACSQAGFRVRCRSGDGRGRPRSRQTSWCRTSPSHGAPSTTAGRVYCPSPPWLVGLRLVTQHSHSTEHRVWGWERWGGNIAREGGKDSGEEEEEEGWASRGKWKETGDWTDRVGKKNSTRKSVIEHSGTILQHLLIPITADIHKQYLAPFIFHTKG